MKNFFTIFLVFAGLIMAQNWEIVREGNVEYYPNAGVFMDEMTGLYVGSDGVVVKTTDGGESGETVRMPDSSGISWKDVQFANPDVGYACAEEGFIYKTIDGGLNWVMVGDTANFKADLLDIAVVDENLVYVAGKDSTLLKTTDGGATWTRSDFSFEGEALDGGLAFLNADTGVVAIDKSSLPMTWYTHDGGATWNPVQIEFPQGTISSRIYDVAAGGNNTIVVVGYHYCIFISTDGGMTYTQSGDYTVSFERYQVADVVNDNVIIVSGSNGHTVKTKDGGTSWDTLAVGSGQTVSFIDFVNENTGYVFLRYGQWFKTTDGGSTFSPLVNWPNISFWGLALPSDNKIVLAAWGGGELSISEDGGLNWSYPVNLATGTAYNLYECEFIDANNGIVAGSYGTMRKTTDGGQTFTFVDNPMYQGTNLHINALRYITDNVVLAGGSKGNIIKSEDGGETWVETVKGGSKTVYDIWPINENQVIASASSGQIYLSNATLDTFTLAHDYGSMSMRAVEFRGDVGIVVASSGHLYRTTVANWDTLIEVFTEPDGDDFYDVEFVTDSLVFVVGEHGKIYKSEDAGQTWMAENSPTEETLQKVRYRNNKLWAVGQNGNVLLLNMTPPQPYTGLYINEFMASNDNTIADETGDYADWIEFYNASDQPIDMGGMLVTDDLGDPFSEWWQIPNRAPDSTTVQPGGFILFWADKKQDIGIMHLKLKLSSGGEQIGLAQIVGGDTVILDSLTFGPQETDTSMGRRTDGADEWVKFYPSTPLDKNENGTIVSIRHDPNAIVHEYALEQNYPNPFNPSTTIKFSLKKAGKVELVVYNATGQKVATLVNKNMKAGLVEVKWDAGKMASGLYFYRLKSGNFTAVKKMLLIK